MNYGKSPLKDAGQTWRKYEDKVVEKVDHAKGTFSNDVNTKGNRRLAVIIVVAVLAAAAIAFAIYANV